MKSITELPIALQELFAELKAEQDAEKAIDGTQLVATEDDILDETELLGTDVDADAVDEDDEEQVDMGAVSPAMLAVFK
jgi:hypothetical protein